MKIISVHPFHIDPDTISYAVKVLREGGVVAHPTDTCYGLAADVFSPEAVKRLCEIKSMSADKPISVIAPSIQGLEKYVVISYRASELMKKYWPGALTIALPHTSKMPEHYNQGFKTIGVRFPDCPWSIALAKSLGRFITTTSANLSGGKNPYSLFDIKREFGDRKIQPDLILDAGELLKRPPSTVVELIDDKIKILRQGEVTVEP